MCAHWIWSRHSAIARLCTHFCQPAGTEGSLCLSKPRGPTMKHPLACCSMDQWTDKWAILAHTNLMEWRTYTSHGTIHNKLLTSDGLSLVKFVITFSHFHSRRRITGNNKTSSCVGTAKRLNFQSMQVGSQIGAPLPNAFPVNYHTI